MDEIKLSLRQIEMMRHAIGLGNDKLKKSRYDAYRNRYIVSKPDENWEYLISIGYASTREFEMENQIGYYVSELGVKYLSDLFGLIITIDK